MGVFDSIGKLFSPAYQFKDDVSSFAKHGYVGDYRGSDTAGRADDKSFGIFQKQLGMLQGRLGEIGGEYDQREQFAEDASMLERSGINRNATSDIDTAQDAAGRTSMYFSGSANKVLENTTANYTDQLRGNAMNLMRQKFDLGLQKKEDTFGIQSNMLDLYANFQAGRQNLKYDASGDFDINQATGLV